MVPERSDSDGDRLPGEPDREAEEAALRAVGLRIIRNSLEATDDDFLAQVLAIYHEEWQRRHNERWVIAE